MENFSIKFFSFIIGDSAVICDESIDITKRSSTKAVLTKADPTKITSTKTVPAKSTLTNLYILLVVWPN